MIAWYTNHFISQKIMRSVAIGFKCIAKDTSLFKEGIKSIDNTEYITYINTTSSKKSI